MSDQQTEGTEDLRFSEKGEKRFQELLKHYPSRQPMVIPALYLAQEEFGYVSVRAMEYVAERLELPPSKVLNVATFYTMFNRHPVGEHQVNVCTGPPCYLRGSDKIVAQLEDRLGIKVGQSTPDRKFTLGRAECLASCDTAPMLECNGIYHENLTPERLDALIDEWSRDGGEG